MSRRTTTYTVNTSVDPSTGVQKTVHNKSTSVSSSYSSGSIVRASGAIALLLLLLNLFMYVQGAPENKFTFSRLLEMISNVPDLKIEDWRIPSITDDWGLFNWFRDFLNMNIAPLNTILFFIGGITTIVVFCSYFLGFLFF